MAVLPGYHTLPYAERLKRLQLPSLELRRLHSDLIYCCKIHIYTWNNLPNSVVFTNLTRFVRTVKRVDLSGYLRCFSY